jgi:hypothetical protein
LWVGSPRGWRPCPYHHLRHTHADIMISSLAPRIMVCSLSSPNSLLSILKAFVANIGGGELGRGPSLGIRNEGVHPVLLRLKGDPSPPLSGWLGSILPGARRQKLGKGRGSMSVTVSEGTTFSASWGPVRNDCVSVRWFPVGWLGSLADRL